ncbi:nucleotidyltransferase [Paenibacillus tarimensis]|uniref:nucleotidyltransferase n=1 Tax=Paenibacillus tarimensis TaxID=416012 RepID=UPI001F27E941|nr:nucleotidyltransferase [Paenibacillus tarimensis]MCF2942263.1 nucleotidyltransferase [Paenibacillus tarimensis]
MRTVGVIVEYNPFHNGHLYHLQQSVRLTGAEAVVAVMSGPFLQRGEPALLSKWARAETALRSGCDLIIELPVAYATNAAQWFAHGAVSLLHATGIVDTLCFGSETGDIDTLRRIAGMLAAEPEDFRALLAAALQSGSNYPAAYSSAVRSYLSGLGLSKAADFPLQEPNNTLGLHYLIALEKIGSSIVPYTVKREKAGYHEESISDNAIASATALRRLLAEHLKPEAIAAYVPPASLRLLKQEWEAHRAPIDWNGFLPRLLHEIVRSSPDELAAYREVNEGLEYRIKQAIPTLPSLEFDSLMEALKTKRYTRTRLQRALLAILLGHRKQDFTAASLASGVEYIRVLGFTDKGRALLKQMRTTASLPVLHSAARPPAAFRMLDLDTKAGAVYALAFGNAGPPDLFRDYFDAPIIV